MSSTDLWTDEEYKYVLERTKKYLWLYVLPSSSISELQNAVHNLTMLNTEDVDLLSTIHFLLSDEVKTFVEALPRIFRRLSHSAQKETIVNRTFVRGKIDWQQTIKERCCQGYNPTIFVCRPHSRIFNLPENQLLKFVLTKIKRLIEETSHLPYIEGKNFDVQDVRTWEDKLSWLMLQVNKGLRNVHLKEVDLPQQVNDRMLRRAETARNKDYEAIANCCSIYGEIIEETDKKMLKELIEKRILEPLQKDTLYELFVLFEILNSFGTPEELNLIKSGAESIGTFKVGEEKVTVYFQRISGLLHNSKYRQIFEDYAFDVALRRPDIILKLHEQNKFFIVEVKRTKSRNYIVDSVYKVLGYLADFSNNFSDQQKPKGILVVWDIKRVKETEQDIIILSNKQVGGEIKKIIERYSDKNS